MNNPSSRKVVSVPIHFVESALKTPKVKPQRTKSSYALKIQKVFRGFLVRKSVKKIIGYKTQVDEIERKISHRETAVLIKRDSKERLKLNEMLMAVLFRLDSVRCIDSGVRDLRKSVIKKAIFLQERVDAIVAGDQASDDVVDHEDGEMESSNGEIVDQTDAAVEKPAIESDSVENPIDEALEQIESANESDNFEASVMETAEITDHGGLSLEKENVDEEEIVQNSDPMHEDGEKEAEEMERQRLDKIEGKRGEIVDDFESMMKRMMEKNEKMMNLVMDLCDKNSLQTQLISAVSQRVENLERAFKSERLRRKKKRQACVGMEKGLES